jgi:hypothetical protein
MSDGDVQLSVVRRAYEVREQDRTPRLKRDHLTQSVGSTPSDSNHKGSPTGPHATRGPC